MNINNDQFWQYWEQGQYEQALQCSAVKQERNNNRLQSILFGSAEQLRQSVAGTALSAGEFIYDLMMINPEVVKGLDFARSEDLSSLFTLHQFAKGIDMNSATGDMAQLQGYVAEQMIAAELQAKGYDVQFPATSNQAGWDILVDGQPFQVKCLSSAEGVHQHFEKYPDIPVYVNEELADQFADNELVYVSSISKEEVISATKQTLSHAEDLLDFEIPWIAAGVSSYYNIKRLWHDNVTISQAVINVMSDTASRVVLGSLGQKAGAVVGVVVFGPAGGIVGSIAGAFAGATQAGKLSNAVKRLFAGKEVDQVIAALVKLIDKVIASLNVKHEIKDKKYEQLQIMLNDSAPGLAMLSDAKQRVEQEKYYVRNKREELLALRYRVMQSKSELDQLIKEVMITVAKSNVHPVQYQQELKQLERAVESLAKKM